MAVAEVFGVRVMEGKLSHVRMRADSVFLTM